MAKVIIVKKYSKVRFPSHLVILRVTLDDDEVVTDLESTELLTLVSIASPVDMINIPETPAVGDILFRSECVSIITNSLTELDNILALIEADLASNFAFQRSAPDSSEQVVVLTDVCVVDTDCEARARVTLPLPDPVNILDPAVFVVKGISTACISSTSSSSSSGPTDPAYPITAPLHFYDMAEDEYLTDTFGLSDLVNSGSTQVDDAAFESSCAEFDGNDKLTGIPDLSGADASWSFWFQATAFGGFQAL